MCLEEPEFWVESGWEENFKKQWREYYHEDWQPPDSSPDAQYRASKLKYLLYRRALSQVFDFVHQYAKEHGREIPCYVATHSLINYADWRIVSPESSLIQVGCDGYIAQVWTGTAPTPNVYDGRLEERTFDSAFLEYGAMQNLVPHQRPARVVSERSRRRQPPAHVDGLSHQLGKHADGLAASAGGLAL